MGVSVHPAAARPCPEGVFPMIPCLNPVNVRILFATTNNSPISRLSKAGLLVTSLSRNIGVKEHDQRRLYSPAVAMPAGFSINCKSCGTSTYFLSIIFYLICVVATPIAQTAYVNDTYEAICDSCGPFKGKYGVKVLFGGYRFWQGGKCSLCPKS